MYEEAIIMDENKENNLNNENVNNQTENQEIKSTINGEIPNAEIQGISEQYNPQAAVAAPVIEKKQRNGLWMTISIISIALCVTSILFSVYLAANGNKNAFKFPAPYTPDYVAGQQLSASDKLDTPAVIAKVKPSVVNILVELGNNYYGQEGSGSGIIFTKDGLIITNAHVVEGATSVKVTTIDGKEYDADIIGYDTVTDLAVIKIDATDLPAAEIGDSSKVVEGEQIIAIGNP
jgi:S1-C subfamily serine protease